MFKYSILIASSFLTINAVHAEEKLKIACLNENKTQCYTTTGAGAITALSFLNMRAIDRVRSMEENAIMTELHERNRHILNTPDRPQSLRGSRIQDLTRDIGDGDSVEITVQLNERDSRAIHSNRLTEEISHLKSEINLQTKNLELATIGYNTRNHPHVKEIAAELAQLEDKLEQLKGAKLDVVNGKVERIFITKSFEATSRAEIESFLTAQHNSGSKVSSLIVTPKATALRFKSFLVRSPQLTKSLNRAGLVTIIALGATAEEGLYGLIADQIDKKSESRIPMKKFEGSK
ncbi:MAG: hypothetical protein V4596_02490 [Bdellovibrionota bacterium]